ncbi:MAG: F0F1 ATP synthase subunit A [Deltaproteobacteria bacterium]|nr:F0F1 ATP synthase subunit A [Deltaproteobacteria bacterium]
MITAIFVALVITGISLACYRKLKHTEQCLVPEKKPTLPGIFELVMELVLGLMRDIMGERAEKYFPLIGSLFIYLLVSNLLGVIPGFMPPTDNINTNLACALTVFLYYNAVGIKEQGWKNYLKHLAGPVLWLAPLMMTIELISHIVRPISLSIRLFGNISGDHLVLEIFSRLVPIGVPIIFMALGVFVAFIQAFVFTLLSMVYIALATDHGHEEHHHETAHHS